MLDHHILYLYIQKKYAEMQDKPVKKEILNPDQIITPRKLFFVKRFHSTTTPPPNSLLRTRARDTRANDAG